MKKVVFADTNIFLHYRSFKEFDLPQILECREVEVVIAPIVFDELDKHKRENDNPKLRDRATSSLKRLEDWIDGGNPIRPNVIVSFHPDRPQDKTLEAHRLSRRSNDDLLLATIIEHKEKYPESDPLLLTADTGARLRAKTLGIEVFELPDRLLLPLAPNPLQKENQRLRRQLAELQSRMPDLSLHFSDGTNGLDVVLEPQLSNLTDPMWKELSDVTSEVQNALDHYLRGHEDSAVHSREQFEDKTTLGTLISALWMNTPSQREIERYERDIDIFRQEYSDHLHRKLKILNEHRRTVRLDLTISNTGYGTANDILLTLSLPEHLQWRWEPDESELSRLIPPDRPKPPQTTAQAFQSNPVFNINMGGLGNLTLEPPPHLLFPLDRADDSPSPVISESGLDLKWEIGKCRQANSLQLPESLFAMFIEPSKITPFSIEYEINDPSLPKPTTGKLNVHVS